MRHCRSSSQIARARIVLPSAPQRINKPGESAPFADAAMNHAADAKTGDSPKTAAAAKHLQPSPVTRYRLGNTINGMLPFAGLLTLPVVFQCSKYRWHPAARGSIFGVPYQASPGTSVYIRLGAPSTAESHKMSTLLPQVYIEKGTHGDARCRKRESSPFLGAEHRSTVRTGRDHHRRSEPLANHVSRR